MDSLERKIEKLRENYWYGEIDSGVLGFQKRVFEEVLDSGNEYLMEQFMGYCYPNENQQIRIAKAMKSSYYIYGVIYYCRPCPMATKIMLPKLMDSHYILRILTGGLGIPKPIRKKLIGRLKESDRAIFINSDYSTVKERAQLVRSLSDRYLIKKLLRWGDTLSQNNKRILERKLRQA